MRLILILFLTLTVGLSAPSQSLAGLFESNIEKARDLAKIEKKYEAKKLLDEAILEDPLDADTHYDAGLVYRQLGMTGDFDLAMKNACKLKSSYCPKVAEPYYSMGFGQLNSGSQRSAIRSFEKAFAYQPAKRTEAINRLFASGKNLLSNENRAGAKNYFSVLTHFSPSHKDKIANYYFDMGKDSSLGAALNLYKVALSFSPALKDKVETQVIAKLSSGEVSKIEKNAAKPKVRKLVSRANFNLLYPPDFRELKINEEYTITDMKDGQSNGFYIRQPMSFPSRMFITSYGTKIKAVIRDGRIIDIGKNEEMPDGDYDFKLVAYADGAKATVWFKK